MKRADVACGRGGVSIRAIQFAKVLWALVAVCALSMGTGCATSSARYYFAAADLDGDRDAPKLTFYRLTVTGDSAFVNAAFQTGYYDANALHELFGEVRKPTVSNPVDGSGQPVGGPLGTITLRIDPATGTPTLVDDNSRFTLLYGVNADAMAEQIRVFAESDQTGQYLGQLLASAGGGADAFADSHESAGKLAKRRQKAKDLAAQIREMLKTLPAPPAAAAAATADPETVDPTVIARRFVPLSLMENASAPIFASALLAAAPAPAGAPAAAPPAAPQQPAASQPAASQPAASQPEASQPAASQPAASQPAASQPAASQPAATQASTTTIATRDELRKALLKVAQSAATAAGSKSTFDADLDKGFDQAKHVYDTLRND